MSSNNNNNNNDKTKTGSNEIGDKFKESFEKFKSLFKPKVKDNSAKGKDNNIKTDPIPLKVNTPTLEKKNSKEENVKRTFKNKMKIAFTHKRQTQMEHKTLDPHYSTINDEAKKKFQEKTHAMSSRFRKFKITLRGKKDIASANDKKVTATTTIEPDAHTVTKHSKNLLYLSQH